MAVLKNKIELKNVSKVYETRDKQVEVLNNLSFEVHENEFLVLLGPGRCGKTVLLNILANLEKQTSGTIEFICTHSFHSPVQQLVKCHLISANHK